MHRLIKYAYIFVSVLFFLSCSKKNVSGNPKAIITVPQGKIKLAFYPEVAPNHVKNFIKLAEDGYYDGTTFHRLVNGFVVQGGDPKSKDNYIFDDGGGGPGYIIKSEFKRKHFRGALAMAKLPKRVNPNHDSNGSQFYIALDSLPQLDKDKHTVFGYVEHGMSVIDKLLKLKRAFGDNPNSSNEKVTQMTIEIVYE